MLGRGCESLVDGGRMKSGWNGGGRDNRNSFGGRDNRPSSGGRNNGPSFEEEFGYGRRELLTPVPQRGANGDEREFFDEKTEVKTHNLVCPHCQQAGDYALSWLVRRKRARMPGYADAAREARFAKARSYMVRRDDVVGCQNVRCRKRFEIAGVQSVAFLEDIASGSVEDRAARVRAAFAGRSR
jgi:hypothetical protein